MGRFRASSCGKRPTPEIQFLRVLPVACALATTLLVSAAPKGATGESYGAELQGFDYPFKVERFAFRAQNQPLSMAFMDIAADRPNGRTALLLHGKNFCAATWQETIERLLAEGFRVVAPDQVGFCKSTKPVSYQYSFEQLATNTHALLEARGIGQVTVIGHSMGGMLAVRYALMFPQEVERLVLVNPIGLEDWRMKGVPPASVDALYRNELETDAASIRSYQEKIYYNGDWKPGYDRWVQMLAGMYAGDGKEAVAWNQALTSDMVYTQPVVHEFSRIEAPTVLMIGGFDRTAPGANRAPAEIAEQLGQYPQLGRAAAQAIPDARLVEFPDLGHAPQVEAPARFHDALLAELRRP